MKTGATPPATRMGIGIKVALLASSVTLLTLLIFGMAIIPEQENAFLENLNSKGHSIALSIQEIYSSAIMNDDSSAVVAHCLELVERDAELNYVAVVRRDGNGLLIQGELRKDSTGRQTKEIRWQDWDQMDPSWKPLERREQGEIRIMPGGGSEAYHYSFPSNHYEVEWGWIHIGLSPDSYRQNVSRLYTRTALIAVVCGVIGACMSIGFSRRLVRPIARLQELVHAVAQGQLSARAEIHSGDEVEVLAHSFNAMNDALQRRDRILQSVRFAAQKLLSTDDWRKVIHDVLAKLARASGVDGTYIFENHPGPDGALLFSQRYEWVLTTGGKALDQHRWKNLRWHGAGLDVWADQFGRGEPAAVHVRELGPAERAVIDPQVQSLLIMPIMVQGAWWGLLGCEQWDSERDWNDAERDSFKAAADMLGAAIEHQITQDVLQQSKETLEQRVLARTVELEEQIQAKERAHAELAAMQQTLMDLSRRSGMAELATGVLHNVGNALNSVNVSATLVADRFRQSRLPNLARLASLMREHKSDLPDFLSRDPSGSLIPHYIIEVCAHLHEEHNGLIDELESMTRSVEHVKDIVSLQQAYTRVGGVTETLSLATVVEESIRLMEGQLTRSRITLKKELTEIPPMPMDRHKILQILTNLLKNAEESIRQAGEKSGLILVRLLPSGPEKVLVQVLDNGVGIEAAELNQLFTFGYTTKHDGHGFGLHASAISAKQMGGMLSAQSPGRGQGATFTLELPSAPSAA
jgi:two-component system, NtrC family, sensor kinase